MSTLVSDIGTGRFGLEFLIIPFHGSWEPPTGWERLAAETKTYTFHYHVSELFEAAVLDKPAGEATSEEEGLRGQAAALAIAVPAVASSSPPPPRLSGNLAEDVHKVSGLRWAEIADVFKISERAAAGWRSQGVPAHRVETMEALRAIGATLVAGMGSEGVATWLSAGKPSRLRRIREGHEEAVAAEALSYRDTPAT
jgi:hypothetical protein